MSFFDWIINHAHQLVSDSLYFHVEYLEGPEMKKRAIRAKTNYFMHSQETIQRFHIHARRGTIDALLSIIHRKSQQWWNSMLVIDIELRTKNSDFIRDIQRWVKTDDREKPEEDKGWYGYTNNTWYFQEMQQKDIHRSSTISIIS